MGPAPLADASKMGARGASRTRHGQYLVEKVVLPSFARWSARGTPQRGEDPQHSDQAGLVEDDASRHRNMGVEMHYLPALQADCDEATVPSINTAGRGVLGGSHD